jgi:hypothetical protein
MTRQLEKRSAVIVAVIGLWLLACLGVFMVLHATDWYFISTKDRSLMTAQIGWFYFAMFGGQLPAIAFVALVVDSSKFHHPVLVAGLLTMIYQLAMFAIHYVRQSGTFAFGPDRWVAVGFDFARIIALVLTVMVIARILGRANRRCRQPPPRRSVA